jgi:hypothetical protein
MPTKKTKPVYRDSDSGRFTPKENVKLHPREDRDRAAPGWQALQEEVIRTIRGASELIGNRQSADALPSHRSMR